jgi:hypothetical protein
MAHLHLNRTEARILAVALNESKLSNYSLSQRTAITELARRLAGFIADESTVPVHEKERGKTAPKKVSAFYDHDRANKTGIFAALRDVEPRPTVSIDDDIM